MKVLIKRFDTSLPLPSYKTDRAACMDLAARLDVTIQPHTIGYIPLNVAVQLPQGYWLLLAARSSTHKLGLIPANGIGIGDNDFCGDNDEYALIVYNFTDQPVTVQRGTRVAQCMIMKQEPIELEEVEFLDNRDRGGIGSTGQHT